MDFFYVIKEIIDDWSNANHEVDNNPIYKSILKTIYSTHRKIWNIINLETEINFFDKQRILDEIEYLSQRDLEQALIFSYYILETFRYYTNFDINNPFIVKILDNINLFLLYRVNIFYKRWWEFRKKAFDVVDKQLKLLISNNLDNKYIIWWNTLLWYWEWLESWNQKKEIISRVDSFIWWKTHQSYWALDREIEVNEDLIYTFDNLIKKWDSESIKKALVIWIEKLWFFSPSQWEYSSILDVASRKYIWEWKKRVEYILYNNFWIWIWYYIDYFDILIKLRNFNDTWKLVKYVSENWIKITDKFIQWVEFLFNKYLDFITNNQTKIFLTQFVLKYWKKT